MIYAYIIPMLVLAAFFLTIFFLFNLIAKIILFSFLLIIMFLPFFVIYKEDVRDKDPVTQKESK
ncbi:hypothetical protein [Halobacillus sp. B23F22_1]|uniref:hypothetical protein n=1 Tax=Halobacillus sp. B23F22_1 TaxID=3459514 RepID=UPI00373F5BBC